MKSLYAVFGSNTTRKLRNAIKSFKYKKKEKKQKTVTFNVCCMKCKELGTYDYTSYKTMYVNKHFGQTCIVFFIKTKQNKK